MSAPRVAVLAATLLALAVRLTAQTADVGAAAWSGSGSLYWYLVPDDSDFGMLIGAADRGSLHLEGRWNYEDIHAGSLFAGWTVSVRSTVEIEVTPMAGMTVGSVLGAVPGLELTVSVGPVEWYTESEYVLDLRDEDDSFFYVWSELGVRPVAPLALGLTAQRLKARRTPLEVDRGPFATLTVDRLSFGAYLLNPWSDSWFGIFSLAVDF